MQPRIYFSVYARGGLASEADIDEGMMSGKPRSFDDYVQAGVLRKRRTKQTMRNAETVNE